MGVVFGLILFLLPFGIYALWWYLAGQQEGITPPPLVLGLAGIAVLMTVGLAFYYGLSRSIDRDQDYVPARIEGSTPPPVQRNR
ncbi:MAG TPA: hypothetical protein VGN96_12715 [Roseococcus sp.]|jgi:hypothetical protein|nr:hypothetical protein [Roseococcus sp.]